MAPPARRRTAPAPAAIPNSPAPVGGNSPEGPGGGPETGCCGLGALVGPAPPPPPVVSEGEGDRVVRVSDGEGVRVVGLSDGEGVRVVGVSDGVAVFVGVSDGVAVFVGVGVAVFVGVGVAVFVGVLVGDGRGQVHVADGDGDGLSVESSAAFVVCPLPVLASAVPPPSAKTVKTTAANGAASSPRLVPLIMSFLLSWKFFTRPG